MHCLADAHKPPVSHGDLSSSNVLVRADGACVLCDFGCSTVLHSFSGYHRRRDTTSLLVSRHMAPKYRSSCVKPGQLCVLFCFGVQKVQLLNLSAETCSVGHFALHVPWDPGRLCPSSQQMVSDARWHLLFGTAPVGDLDVLRWFQSRYIEQISAGAQVQQPEHFCLCFSVPVYRKCCSTASVAIRIWAGSQCVHREPHFARVSHGHETFHTATLGRAFTGIPKYSINVVNVLLLNSFITCRGLPWRRSWQTLGTLNQMPVCLLSVLQTDWPLSIIMYLLSTPLLLFLCLLFSCIQMSHPLVHFVYYSNVNYLCTFRSIFNVLQL